MQGFLNRKRQEPMSLEELQELLPDFASVQYDKLDRPLMEIIGNKSGALLYYEMHKRNGDAAEVGHFSLVLKGKGQPEYFSSYGFSPFQEIDKTRSEIAVFRRLFPKNLKINKTRFQRIKNTDTCGRWVLLRAKFKNLSLKQFARLFGSRRFSIQSLDDLVVIATAALVDLD